MSLFLHYPYARDFLGDSRNLDHLEMKIAEFDNYDTSRVAVAKVKTAEVLARATALLDEMHASSMRPGLRAPQPGREGPVL